jgi:hypothetical protein
MLYLITRASPAMVPNQYAAERKSGSYRFSAPLQRTGPRGAWGVYVAEESTAFPGVSKPVYLSGLASP